MKTYLLLLVLFVTACNCDEDFPAAPYPGYDDKSIYYGTDGYQTITYTYYCRGGKYLSITYTQVKSCDTWEKTQYSSNGICK